MLFVLLSSFKMSKPANKKRLPLAKVLAKIQPGQVLPAVHKGDHLAVFRLASGDIAWTEDACPHAGTPLSTGYIEGDSLCCPTHNFCFSAKDGSCDIGQTYQIDIYRAVGGPKAKEILTMEDRSR